MSAPLPRPARHAPRHRPRPAVAAQLSCLPAPRPDTWICAICIRPVRQCALTMHTAPGGRFRGLSAWAVASGAACVRVWLACRHTSIR